MRSNKYRIKMTDVFNNQRFAFACLYPAANVKAACILARKEWGTSVIIENVTRQVEGGYTQYL